MSLNYIPVLPDVLFPIDPELIVIILSLIYVLVVYILFKDPRILTVSLVPPMLITFWSLLSPPIVILVLVDPIYNEPDVESI